MHPPKKANATFNTQRSTLTKIINTTHKNALLPSTIFHAPTKEQIALIMHQLIKNLRESGNFKVTQSRPRNVGMNINSCQRKGYFDVSNIS
jgi:hypothetical protein